MLPSTACPSRIRERAKAHIALHCATESFDARARYQTVGCASPIHAPITSVGYRGCRFARACTPSGSQSSNHFALDQLTKIVRSSRWRDVDRRLATVRIMASRTVIADGFAPPQAAQDLRIVAD